jgi:hypothetical protein
MVDRKVRVQTTAKDANVTRQQLVALMKKSQQASKSGRKSR